MKKIICAVATIMLVSLSSLANQWDEFVTTLSKNSETNIEAIVNTVIRTTNTNAVQRLVSSGWKDESAWIELGFYSDMQIDLLCAYLVNNTVKDTNGVSKIIIDNFPINYYLETLPYFKPKDVVDAALLVAGKSETPVYNKILVLLASTCEKVFSTTATYDKDTLVDKIYIYGAGSSVMPRFNLSLEQKIEVVLAPEPQISSLREETRTLFYSLLHIEDDIYQEALRLAKIKMREEGKSFVTINGVNPLVEKLQPVVDALNAPMFNGLEKALANIGYTNVFTVDRDKFSIYATQVQNDIWFGKTAPDPYSLKKVQLLLGVENYNKWVNSFNKGADPVEKIIKQK